MCNNERRNNRQKDAEITTNAQKLSAITPNIVNILILITAVSKTSLRPKELARVYRPTNENFKANFARLVFSPRFGCTYG